MCIRDSLSGNLQLSDARDTPTILSVLAQARCQLNFFPYHPLPSLSSQSVRRSTITTNWRPAYKSFSISLVARSSTKSLVPDREWTSQKFGPAPIRSHNQVQLQHISQLGPLSILYPLQSRIPVLYLKIWDISTPYPDPIVSYPIQFTLDLQLNPPQSWFKPRMQIRVYKSELDSN